jgi:hypothetical protein
VLGKLRTEEAVLGEEGLEVATFEEMSIEETVVLEITMLESENILLLGSTLLRWELTVELITAVKLERGVLLRRSIGYEDMIGVELDPGTTLDEVTEIDEALLNADVM